MAKTAIQKFEYREIPRIQIKAAPYNPRQINAYQRANLKKDLEKFGMVEPLVWNEKTGNLVSGHQRLSILDELEGNADYTVAVAVVKLSEKAEKQLNVLMNNPAAMGSYTSEGLIALMKDGISLEEMALTRIDLEEYFGEAPELNDVLAGLQEAKDAKKKPKDEPKLNKNEIRKNAADDPENDADYYLLVAFDSSADKAEWLNAHSFPPDLKHISYREFEVVLT